MLSARAKKGLKRGEILSSDNFYIDEDLIHGTFSTLSHTEGIGAIVGAAFLGNNIKVNTVSKKETDCKLNDLFMLYNKKRLKVNVQLGEEISSDMIEDAQIEINKQKLKKEIENNMWL